jgi:signal transduction histidine kinase
VHTDGDQLRQVLINLVDKRSSTPAGGECASARRRRRRGTPGIEIAVADTGVGIQPRPARLTGASSA